MRRKRELDASIGVRLRLFRKAVNAKTVEFCDLIGIAHGSLSDIENGKTGASQSTIQSLVRNTEINPLWLLIGEGPMKRGVREKKHSNTEADTSAEIPIMSYVDVGAAYAAQIPIEENLTVNLPGRFAKNTYALKMIGDYMEPLVYDGDFLIIAEISPEAMKSGLDYVVVTESGPAAKQVYLESNQYRLRSRNAKYRDLEVSTLFRAFSIIDHLHPYRAA